MTSFIVKEESETIRHFKLSKCTPFYLKPQGSEEMCLSLEHGLEHQNPSKTSEKMGYFDRLQFRYTFYRPQTKRLRARKIGFSLKYGKLVVFLLGTSCLGRPSGNVPCASEDMACVY